MFQFEVIGNPRPQEQMDTACDCPKGQKCKKWLYNPCKKEIEIIQWQIRPTSPTEPLLGPIELSIWFFLPIPKATTSKNRTAMLNRVILPVSPPDEDNLAYLITNALKKIVYKDDAQVCAKHVYKLYGDPPRTVIRVRPILQVAEVGLHEINL